MALNLLRKAVVGNSSPRDVGAASSGDCPPRYCEEDAKMFPTVTKEPAPFPFSESEVIVASELSRALTAVTSNYNSVQALQAELATRCRKLDKRTKNHVKKHNWPKWLCTERNVRERSPFNFDLVRDRANIWFDDAKTYNADEVRVIICAGLLMLQLASERFDVVLAGCYGAGVWTHAVTAVVAYHGTEKTVRPSVFAPEAESYAMVVSMVLSEDDVFSAAGARAVVRSSLSAAIYYDQYIVPASSKRGGGLSNMPASGHILKALRELKFDLELVDGYRLSHDSNPWYMECIRLYRKIETVANSDYEAVGPAEAAAVQKLKLG